MAGDCLRVPLLDSELPRNASAEVRVNINGCDGATIQSLTTSKSHAGNGEQLKDIEDQNPFDFIGAGSFTEPPSSTIDPFRNNTPKIKGLYEWLKILVCIPIVIVRLILFGLSLAVGYIATRCALLGWKDKQSPMPKWRCRIMWITRICSRSILFSFGYHWIKRIGRPAPRETAPIVVSNHVSYIDPIFFFYELCPTIVSSESHDTMPFVGTIIRAMQRKASCNDFPRVLLFPEGTTTNGRVLIAFQLGAFIPGYPIQPVVVRYPHVHFDQSWGNISLAMSMFRMFTQFHNFMEIEYLPIVLPLENQKDSAAQFANRTSYVMASALNVIQTSHSYLDSLLVTEALNSKQEKASTYMVEISKSFNVSTLQAMDFLDKFLSMNPDSSGRVKIHDFLRVQRLRASPHSEKIFGYLDVEKQGSITFRQFFFGSAHILKTPLFWQACELAFAECDGNGSNYVSQQQLHDSLKMTMPVLSEEEEGELFNIFDTDGDGRVSKEDFMTSLRKHPLLIALFSHVSAIQGLLSR